MDQSNQEFLPLCDVIFNIISLGAYFSNVVFDFVAVYWLHQEGYTRWFNICLASILCSLILSQIVSLAWFLNSFKQRNERKYVVAVADQQPRPPIQVQHEYYNVPLPQSNVPKAKLPTGFVCSFSKTEVDVWLVFLIHLCQAGVLWRYFKLFMPVDLRYVKQDVCDLCLLRLVHAFCEAAPMLLIQLYLIWETSVQDLVPQSAIVSSTLCLINIAWALASFNKHIRKSDLHRLVLTWLGVIFQFLWRLGTVFSRAVALTLYASLYHNWVFLVIILHWFSMLLWLLSPKNVFSKEKMSWFKKISYAGLVAFAYIFCYINLQSTNVRQKIAAFYITMFLENTLLVSVWLGQKVDSNLWYQTLAVISVWGGFASGMLWMILYYKYFHVCRLKSAQNLGLRDGENTVACANCSSGRFCDIHSQSNSITYQNVPVQHPSHLNYPVAHSSHEGYPYRPQQITRGMGYVPGVFNCKLNPAAFKRKRKKPTSFVPPPVNQGGPYPYVNVGGKMEIPFWKQPLPVSFVHSQSGSETTSSTGLKINIQEKLQEKKRQQLQELQVIQEEIKQGKIQRPQLDDISEQSTIRMPIPQSKKQPRMKREANHYGELRQTAPYRKKHYNSHRPRTPELLLSPQYLEYQDHWKPNSDSSNISSASCHGRDLSRLRKNNRYKSYRNPSDVESQVSLSRSYTLPREFRYRQKMKSRRPTRHHHGHYDHVFMTSTNSSDGDVDSADDELDSESERGAGARVMVTSTNHRQLPNYRKQLYHHETKL